MAVPMEEAQQTRTKAAVRERYGGPDVVAVRDVDVSAPAADELLVRVRAASLNMADWYSVAGRPLVGRASMGFRPKTERIGVDYAGVVEAVGRDVTRFEPGDEVFGGRTGAFAGLLLVREDGAVAGKPRNVSFEDAAAAPVAAVTALQGLRDKGGLQPGQRVLVNGASGGVGTYAVQIATALGADVTAVCSTRNVETARSLGAERVVDYTREDFTRGGGSYDLVFDVAGNRAWSDVRRVLDPTGRLVIAGGPRGGRLLGPLGHVVATRFRALGSRRTVIFFLAKLDAESLDAVRELLESGRLRSVVDRTYGLDEVGQALAYLGEGHARGKVVLTVGAC